MAKRVLVLDDDIGVLEAIETALTYEGFEVRTLGRTYNIFKNIQDFNPDVLIVDLFLGGINGAELCKKIKNNRETQDLAVIIISAYKTNIDVLHSFGCDHFIPKPFDLAELYQGINKVLRMNKLAID
jgi:DNA-binding response OmpR family regulator